MKKTNTKRSASDERFDKETSKIDALMSQYHHEHYGCGKVYLVTKLDFPNGYKYPGVATLDAKWNGRSTRLPLDGTSGRMIYFRCLVPPVAPGEPPSPIMNQRIVVFDVGVTEPLRTKSEVRTCGKTKAHRFVHNIHVNDQDRYRAGRDIYTLPS